MKNSLHYSLTVELRDIVHQHLDEVRACLMVGNDDEPHVPEAILAHLKRLADSCRAGRGMASPDLYHEVLESKAAVETFLKLMNQDLDVAFYQTEVGRLLAQTDAWCQAAGAVQLSVYEVWDYIAPVKPDHLAEIDSGLFEAQWWQPVPWMDIEILRRTEGVVIQHEQRDPSHLPGGVLVRFSIESS